LDQLVLVQLQVEDVQVLLMYAQVRVLVQEEEVAEGCLVVLWRPRVAAQSSEI
jgi:hypothetical protein